MLVTGGASNAVLLFENLSGFDEVRITRVVLSGPPFSLPLPTIATSEFTVRFSYSVTAFSLGNLGIDDLSIT